MESYNQHFAAEYSQSQQAFNICTLAELIERNIRAIVLNKPHDWQLIGIFNTYERADAELKDFQYLVESRRRQEATI